MAPLFHFGIPVSLFVILRAAQEGDPGA